MATNDSKYVSYHDIWAKITRVHKHKEVQAADILEWAVEMETDFLRDAEASRKYTAVELEVDDDYKARLPCNVIRILDVMLDYENSESRVLYNNMGAYINFDDNIIFDKNNVGNNIVYINYMGIAVDSKTGYPLIKKGHEQACEAFCVWKLYLEDYLNNKIDGQRWDFIDSQKEHHILAANSGFRNWSRGRLERLQLIKMNMVPKINQLPLYNLQWEDR